MATRSSQKVPGGRSRAEMELEPSYLFGAAIEAWALRFDVDRLSGSGCLDDGVDYFEGGEPVAAAADRFGLAANDRREVGHLVGQRVAAVETGG